MRGIEMLNDGLLEFGVIETKRVNGKKTGQMFRPVYPLYFNRQTVRQSDIEIADATGQTIDLKVKTLYVKGVSKGSHKVKIDNAFYDIYLIDSDPDNKYLYWYLSKVDRND